MYEAAAVIRGGHGLHPASMELDGHRPRLRVLLADDSPFIRDAMADLVAGDASLELVGIAEDADKAIELAGLEQPDVAVIDVRMPGGGGPGAIRGIRRRSPHTRVVVLSAFGDRDTVLQMLRAGIDAYVEKGGLGDEVLHAIHYVVEGQNRFVPDLVQELTRKLAAEERDAERRRQRAERIRRLIHGEDLTMVFQPIVDLRDGRVLAQEALARIATPPRRSPDWWLAEAGALGLDVELELAAVSAALACLERLPAQMDLSVNASPRTIASPQLLETLGKVPAGRVILEVTEHTPVEDHAALDEALGRLRIGGVRLAIDDAGAGFSSLGNILRITPDFIKLDISLIRGIEHHEAHRATASALARFGSDIGAEIIAEGIETHAELLALRALGIRFGQGFGLARPGPLPSGGVLTRIELSSGT